jgi:hypothetical protein
MQHTTATTNEIVARAEETYPLTHRPSADDRRERLGAGLVRRASEYSPPIRGSLLVPKAKGSASKPAEKDLAAMSLGRRGGLKSRAVRAQALTPRRRSGSRKGLR